MNVIINPGTGHVSGARLKDAWASVRAFRRELSPRMGCRLLLIRDPIEDEDGRYGFILSHGGRDCRVLMPGRPLADVKNEWLAAAPRLYIDGSSWWWKWAIDAATWPESWRRTKR